MHLKRKRCTLTCIVGIEYAPGAVVLGADSHIAGANGLSTSCPVIKLGSKGAWHWGTSGYLSDHQILQYEAEWPFVEAGHGLPQVFATMRAATKLFFRGPDGRAGSSVLLTVNGKVYSSDPDGAIEPHACGYHAIGEGAASALGALDALALGSVTDPIIRAELALRSADLRSPWVSRPFTIWRIVDNKIAETHTTFSQ